MNETNPGLCEECEETLEFVYIYDLVISNSILYITKLSLTLHN